MRWLALLFAVILPSCTAWDRSVGAARFRTPLTFATPDPEDPLANLDPDHPIVPAARPAPLPPQSVLSLGVHRLTSREISLTVLAFDDREFALSIADKVGGPETAWQSAQAAARAHGAIAAINAGFFTPAGKPLGLVIEDGTRIGSWNTASSLTSGVLAIQNGRPRLLRSRNWSSSATARHLVQTGPLLLENGSSISGLSSRSQRPRSFIAWDGRHHWAIGSARAATLAELSSALAAQPLAGAHFTTALNFDGGRSTDLWVSSDIKGGPVSTRRIWNKPVRNYVLLRKRPR